MKFTFFKSLIQSYSGTSSKRFCAVIGWITCLIVVLYCTFTDTQAPDITEYLFICSTALLGVSTVAGAFDKKDYSNKNINKDKIK